MASTQVAVLHQPSRRPKTLSREGWIWDKGALQVECPLTEMLGTKNVSNLVFLDACIFIIILGMGP